MGWSVIRTATDEDVSRLESSAKRFCKRHGLKREPEDETATDTVTRECDYANYLSEENEPFGGRSALSYYWRPVVRRALRSSRADGIAWGVVGFHVD